LEFDHTVYFKNGFESLKSTINMFWQRSVCVSEYFIHYHLSFHDMCLFMLFRGVAQFIIHKW